jgi:hypothetical protein
MLALFGTPAVMAKRDGARFGNTQPMSVPLATDFDKGIVWIKWIGTHQDCDKIGARLRRYFDSVFR